MKGVAKYFLLTLLVILVDQGVKLLVHFNMDLGLAGQVKVFDDWFKLHYTLNPGMAFGLELGSENGKLFLTVFRIGAGIAIAYYLVFLHKKSVKEGLLWSMALILGGAIGNVLDSTFYGVILDNAPYGSSTPWFHGQVVDMFYIDIWEGVLPSWIPFLGGQYYSLWPIFNIADASIFCGVAFILIFQKKFFPSNEKINQENGIESSTL
jgi:signal peptidase II